MRYLIAIGIPLLLLLCGALAKKLVRGTRFQQEDFFLGVELTLAALTSGMLYFFELVQFTPTGIVLLAHPEKLLVAAVFVPICFALLLWVLSTHQDWERLSTRTVGRFGRLALFSNGIGVGLVCAFALLVKGI